MYYKGDIMKMIFKALVLLIFSSSIANAHGMDKLGPHKGYVQMPGAFHTEVVQDKDGSFRIYLLDVEFKNAITKNSEIKAKIKSGRTYQLNCMVMNDYFHCVGTKEVTGNGSGELYISATRDGIKGNEAVYQLPLKLQK